MSSPCVVPLSSPADIMNNRPEMKKVSQALLLKDILQHKLSKQYDTHIVHRVKATDTLPHISSLYGVPISDIKKLNCLTSHEIWFRKTLMIPNANSDGVVISQTELQNAHGGDTAAVGVSTKAAAAKTSSADSTNSENEGYNHYQRRMENAASESQKVSALKKLVNLDQAILRDLLITQGWDLRRTIKVAEWIQRITKHGALDPDIKIDEREALAYLEMNGYNLIRTEMQLEADVRWEKTLKWGHSEQAASCDGSVAECLRKFGIEFRPTAICGRGRNKCHKYHPETSGSSGSQLGSQLVVLDHDVGCDEEKHFSSSTSQSRPLNAEADKLRSSLHNANTNSNSSSSDQLMRAFAPFGDDDCYHNSYYTSARKNALRSRRLTVTLEHTPSSAGHKDEQHNHDDDDVDDDHHHHHRHAEIQLTNLNKPKLS